MCGQITHRGPDDQGTLVRPGVALGMRRLSIIDVSGGHQPISNEDGTVWVVYNGESYNYLDVCADLERRGHRFKTRCDTEVTVHAWEEYGEASVEQLRGMYAYAIWDAPQETLFLARDRLGKKPLYYTVVDGSILFASEIKAMLAHRAVPREMEPLALDGYLAFQYVPGPQTIFRGIYRLLPGQTLTWHNGTLRLRQYWQPDYTPHQPAASEAEYLERTTELLREAVRLRLMSEVPLGAFLSGGLDSSVIVGLMAGLMEQPVKTFSVGFGEGGEVDEVAHARLVAEHFGTDHHEITVRADAAELLPKLAWHLYEPIADAAAIPTFLISQVARQHVTVVLTGEGGDELFAGYARYYGDALFAKVDALPELARKPLAAAGALLPEMSEQRVVRYARRALRAAGQSRPERYQAWVTTFQPAERQALYSPAWRASLNNTQFAHPGAAVLHSSSANGAQTPLGALLHFDVLGWLPEDLLMKVDKMGMAASIEARTPYLDHKLFEYVAGMPDAMKLRGGTSKYLLRKIAAGLLPERIRQRKKHGFDVPIQRWLRDDLRALLHERLSAERLRLHGCFAPNEVARLIAEHESGRRDHQRKLWTLLCFQLWYDAFIAASSDALAQVGRAATP
jgi:asparagine synthase (glutamine-hydrolysing)